MSGTQYGAAGAVPCFRTMVWLEPRVVEAPQVRPIGLELLAAAATLELAEHAAEVRQRVPK